MSGPTPGPWVAHGLMVSEANQPLGKGRDICHCGIGMRHDPSESEANADLIAAAPELLAALQRWLALDGSAWHADRHAAEKCRLIADTAALIANMPFADYRKIDAVNWSSLSYMNKPRYFSYDPDSCFDTHESAEDARKSAEETIDYYRDNAGGGWSEHVEGVCWGVILSVVEETENRPRYEDDGCNQDCEFVVDYGLTDAADPFKELSELRHAAWVLKQACKTAIAQLKGREHDEFLRLAIAAADAAGIKS